MRKNVNSVNVIGRVYSFGEANGKNMLAIKVTGEKSKNPNTTYIGGTINVAVDDAGLNVIPVHFSYVTATTKNGNPNATFNALKKIIESKQIWTEVGKDNALKVKIDTSIALNDFYVEENGETRLVSSKLCEGGFVTLLNEFPEDADVNKFTTDIVITNVERVEANPEKNIEEHVRIRGAIFDFRNALLPVDFTVKNENGMAYFESLGANSAEPVYTKVWGKVNCETVVTTSTEESAFGEASVRTFERKVREWIITGTAKETYEFGEENVLTAEELTKAMQDRQVYLAEVKKNQDEWKANKSNPTAAPAGNQAPIAKVGGFSF